MELYEHIHRPANINNPPPINNTHSLINNSPITYDLFGQFGYSCTDMHPFQADSQLWITLFEIALMKSVDLAQRLEYIRLVGALLIQDQQFGFIIKPIIDNTGQNGWKSQEHYDQEKQCLNPFLTELIDSLRELRQRFDSGKIM